MKILILAWNYPPALGGIEYVAWHLTSGLAVAGDELRVIARHDPDGEFQPFLHRPGRAGLVGYLFFSLLTAWRLLRKSPADIIVCPGIVDTPAAWVLGKLFKVPYVVLAHGSDVLYGGALYRLGMRFLFRQAGGVAANSLFTRELLERIGCDPKRLMIIHPGVNASKYPQHTEGWRASVRDKHCLKDKMVLLSVGRLIRRKGVLDFVDKVLPKLVLDVPELVYVVVGGDAHQSLVHKEPMSDRIRALVKQRGLDRHVCLLGAVDDEMLHELHYAADVHVLPVIELPGDAEGFGIVLLEAALAETPVVATATGGIPEAVGNKGNGILIEPGDWEGMAKTISSLLREPERLKQLGLQGRKRVLAQFDWPIIVDQYRSFFRAVLAREDDSKEV